MLFSIGGALSQKHVPYLITEIETDCKLAQAGQKVDIAKTQLKVQRLEIALKANKSAPTSADQRKLQRLKDQVATMSMPSKRIDKAIPTKSWVKPAMVTASVAIGVAGLAFAAYKSGMFSSAVIHPSGAGGKPASSGASMPSSKLTRMSYAHRFGPPQSSLNSAPKDGFAGASSAIPPKLDILVSVHTPPTGVQEQPGLKTYVYMTPIVGFAFIGLFLYVIKNIFETRRVFQDLALTHSQTGQLLRTMILSELIPDAVTRGALVALNLVPGVGDQAFGLDGSE
jgi:hypothetical protein